MISVVITAWDRRHFLKKAVDSVLAQTLPRDSYEIVVIKNFHDPFIDGPLAEAGCRLVFDDAPYLGATVALGLEVARGSVICFLDDDDEFVPTKLETVARLFRRDPSLDLVRNSHVSIDPEGMLIPAWPVCEWPATPRAPGLSTTVRTDREKRRGRLLPMYNLSTMSARRQALLPFVAAFREIPASPDSMVFLAALSGLHAVRITPEPLTRHRIHASTSMETFDEGGLVPPSDAAYLARSLDALARQEEMVRGTAAERTAHFLLLITRFDATMSLLQFPVPSWRDHFDFVRTSIREGQIFRLTIVLFTIARRVAPKWAIRHWWILRAREHRRSVSGVDHARLFASKPARPPRDGPGRTRPTP